MKSDSTEHDNGSSEGSGQSRLTRRKFLVRGTGVAGGALFGLYVQPSLKSLEIPKAYANGTPTPVPCADNSPPAVTVIRPNGPSPALPQGEVWHFNTTETIRWTADDPDGVSSLTPLVVEIRFDANSGNDGYPYLIASGIVQTVGGVSTYDWDIGPYDSYLASSTCRVKVIVRDLCDAVASDISDGDFCPPDPSAEGGGFSSGLSTTPSSPPPGAGTPPSEEWQWKSFGLAGKPPRD